LTVPTSAIWPPKSLGAISLLLNIASDVIQPAVASFHLLRLGIGEEAHDVVKKSLSISDHGLNLTLGYFGDVAIVEAVAQSVNVIEAAPSSVFPLDRVSEALKDHRTMAFRASQPITRSFERSSSEPKGRVVSNGEASRGRVVLSACIGDAAACTLDQTFDRVPVGISGV